MTLARLTGKLGHPARTAGALHRDRKKGRKAMEMREGKYDEGMKTKRVKCHWLKYIDKCCVSKEAWERPGGQG